MLMIIRRILSLRAEKQLKSGLNTMVERAEVLVPPVPSVPSVHSVPSVPGVRMVF